MIVRSRSTSPTGIRRQKDRPIRQRTPPEEHASRSPTPTDFRPRKRPGTTSRLSAADREATRLRQLQRENQQRLQAQVDAQAREGDDLVKQHYNAVPQRGKDWRRNDSKIKGLRSLNNWIKSTVIQKFSPSETFEPGSHANAPHHIHEKGLLVLDIGCGKGGDLQKWHAAPQKVDLYVGLDPADVSIDQARGRYREMEGKARRSQLGRRKLFRAEFGVKDCFGSWIGDVPIVHEVGIDGSVGPDGQAHLARWGGGGFDVVSMMFCLHYSFENEEKARNMLRNVAGSLKKGGRFLGVMPDSDCIAAKLAEYNSRRGIKLAIGGDESDDEWDPEKPSENKLVPETLDDASQDVSEGLEFGNDLFRVRIPNAARLPVDGIFRPPFGWKYNYFLEEAVEVPEFVVPWEALRAMAADYNLELEYHKSFNEIWREERKDPVLGPLSERMGVVDRISGKLNVTDMEMEAAAFYVAFSFYKV